MNPRIVSCIVALPLTATAQGTGGDPGDRLDAPGAPTDRYLSAGELRDTLHAATDALFACFRTHAGLARQGMDLAVTFTVQRDGRPDPVLLEGPAPPPLATCLTDAFGRVSFGTHDGPPLEASYPIVFTIDARGARLLPYPVVFVRPSALRLPGIEVPATATAGAVRLLELALFGQSARPAAIAGDGGADAPAAEVPSDDAPADAAADAAEGG